MFEKKSCALKIATLIFVIALIAGMSSIISAENAGQWVASPSSSACPSSGLNNGCDVGTVCSDWDVDGLTLTSCCIAPEYLGTSVLNACGN